MMEQNNSEKNEKSVFLSRYEEISVRQLVPENIDTYADGVLSDLIDLAEEILEKHKWESVAGKDWEDKAFEEEGVPSIGEKLTQAAKEVEDMKTINARLDSLLEEGYVILPPDGSNKHQAQESGSGSDKSWPNGEHPTNHSSSGNEDKKLNPALKTKTILFILSQKFGEDISEDGPIKILKGKSGDKKQRWAEQYFCIEAPNQNKIIFSCDKEDNGTFVVDKDDLKNARDENGDPIDFEQLKRMSRSKLRELINRQMPNSKCIDYRGNFVGRIYNAISTNS